MRNFQEPVQPAKQKTAASLTSAVEGEATNAKAHATSEAVSTMLRTLVTLAL